LYDEDNDDNLSKEDLGIISNEEEDCMKEENQEWQTHYEDNLNTEIERILIDIYNNHITVNKRKKMDFSKYEKSVK
jgi:hypothetical protein